MNVEHVLIYSQIRVSAGSAYLARSEKQNLK
jgi:hypothetical protein